MVKTQDDLPRCAHYASKYLPLTENWIYRILVNHKNYKPVFLTRKKENLSLFPISDICSLDDFGKVRQYFEILLFRVLGYFIFFKKICEQNKIQILHVHFGYHGVKMIGLCQKLKIPMICSFYGDDAFAHGHIQKAKEKYEVLFKESDRILVLGPYMKSQIINLGCAANKITIHHLGIDVDKIEFKKRNANKNGKIRFLIASSFVKKKGIELAIKALSKFKDQYEFSLDIIGDGLLKPQILDSINQAGIEARTTLHGYRPYDYFINLAYQCDVFIQASLTTEDNRKEGTPMAIVDAMATGMAIISTKHSDIPEIVKNDEHGYLAEENDVVTLEKCIQRFFNEPDKVEVFSVNCRRWVEKEFNAKIQTAKLEEYYSELILKKYTSLIP
jgi:colanic acid/amylovoran biosynthesis glycosyltransferase